MATRTVHVAFDDADKKQVATIGGMVLYRLTPANAEEINRRRDRARNAPANAWGFQAPVGNEAAADQEYPAVVVRVFGTGTAANLKVLLDGSDELWVTSAAEGDAAGSWSWPPRS